MIPLHRLSVTREPFHLNPDLIVAIEASPDCHITLASGQKFAVAESVDEVVERVRQWRVSIASQASIRRI